VVPIFNEEDVLPILLERLGALFGIEGVSCAEYRRVRVLFVDDGSEDGSAELLRQAIQLGFPGVLIRLTRNFGHQAAVTAGMDRADANLVAVLDADLQDPPELLIEMTEKWREGGDVVYAERKNRKESTLKRFSYWAFYRLVGILAEVRLPLDSGDFCLMDRAVVEALKNLPEDLRFPRGLRAWVGFHQVGVPYDRPERQAGTPKYGWKKLYQLATDGIASSSIRPLRGAQVLSFVYFLGTLPILLGLLWEALRSSGSSSSWQLLLIAFVVILGNATQLLCIYLLGAYLGRTYLEVKGRPPYLLREVFDASEEKG
jgi:dolichol-phosphate mannosyltransferase